MASLQKNFKALVASFAEFKKLSATVDMSESPAAPSRAVLLSWFQAMDSDRTGAVSYKNLCDACDAVSDAQAFARTRIDEEELRDMMDKYDKDGDGLLCEDEFFFAMKGYVPAPTKLAAPAFMPN